MNRSIWPSHSSVVERHWGYECQWSTMLPLDGKVLYIKKGARTSMKMFPNKDEVLFIQQGCIDATVADQEIFTKPRASFRRLKLSDGDVLNIQAGCPYRLEAASDSIVIEISSGHLSECVRFDDDFGRCTDHEMSLLVREKLERLENDCN